MEEVNKKHNLISIKKKILLSIFFTILICIFIPLNNKSKATDEIYSISDGVIKGILPKTSLSDFRNNINNENAYIEGLDEDSYIGTGMIVTIDDLQYSVYVVGDLNGDGNATITDLVKLKLHNVNIENLEEKYLYGADINNSGDVTITDLVQLNLAVLNIKDILAPKSFEPTVKVSETAITIEGSSTDEKSGIAEYYFQLDDEDWVKNEDALNGKYEFTNIDTSIKHNVRMMAKDNAENAIITKTISVENEMYKINLIPSTTDWTNEDITVSLECEESLSNIDLKISVDGGDTFEEYIAPVDISTNTTVVGKMIYKETLNEVERTLVISNIDKLMPKRFVPNISKSDTKIEITNVQTEDSEATDEFSCSGLKEYTYILRNREEVLQQVETSETSYTFNIEQEDNYIIQILATDNAGNVYTYEDSMNMTNESYTLFIDADGGEYDDENTVLGENGEIVRLVTPIRRGYKFTGWELSGEGILSETIYTFGEGNATITAQWELETYSIEYNYSNGEATEEMPDSYTIFSEDIIIPEPVREGYTFIGWAVTTEGDEENSEPETETVIESGSMGNIVCTAHWTPNVHTITYNCDGGIILIGSEEIEFGESVVLDEPVKDGYVFVGWYDNEELNGEMYEADSYYTLEEDEDIILYAKWMEIGIYAKLLENGTLSITQIEKNTEEEIVNYGKVEINENEEFIQPWINDLENIQLVRIEDVISPLAMDNWFANCTNLEAIDGIENIDATNLTSMKNTFLNCSKIEFISLGWLDTSNVTNFEGLFDGCEKLSILDINSIDTSNAINMSKMFKGCKSLDIITLNNFSTTNVTDMSRMFEECENLIVLDISSFNTENVTTMQDMFSGCKLLDNLNITNFNTDNVEYMTRMFYNCEQLTSLNLSGFNIEKVEYYADMFTGCNSIEKIIINNEWDNLDVFNDCDIDESIIERIGVIAIDFDANGGTVPVARIVASPGDDISELMPIPEKSYTIKYECNDGSVLSDTIIFCDFDGWYTEEDGGERVEYTTMPETSQKLYAHWINKQVELPILTRNNYIFLGWCIDEDLNITIAPEITLGSDLKLYALWAEE